MQGPIIDRLLNGLQLSKLLDGVPGVNSPDLSARAHHSYINRLLLMEKLFDGALTHRGVRELLRSTSCTPTLQVLILTRPTGRPLSVCA